MGLRRSASLVNGKSSAIFDAVVGLLTNNRSLPYIYPLPILYYFDASHVGQKTNMGLKRLADLVNGKSSAIF
jgi:hypothetical protein